MALDRSIALLSGLPGVPARDLAKLVGRELEQCAGLSRTVGAYALTPNDILQVFRVGGGAGYMAVYVPGDALGSIPKIVDQLTAAVRNPYAVLDDYGILLINGSAGTPSKITLAGGSYCSVSLQQRGGRWAVVKTVAKDGIASDADAVRRHQNEAEWLSAVNRFSSWFVTVESVIDEESSYSFASEFFQAIRQPSCSFSGA
jgi:hypothetical protein